MQEGDKVTFTVGGIEYEATVLKPGEEYSLIRVEDGSGHEMDFANYRLVKANG